jgi:hypothetical protein
LSSGTALKRKQTKVRSAPRYFLRVLFISALLLLMNGVLLLAQMDLVDTLFANLFVGFWLSLLSAAFARALDKRLILIAYRSHKWLLESGLVEEIYPD